MKNDFFWHYNYAPHMVFTHNYGCCGSISGLTAGDYDTAGEGGDRIVTKHITCVAAQFEV